MLFALRTLILLGLGYALGFVMFTVLLPLPVMLPPTQIDGIVVFTGGEGRVDAAMDMLHSGFSGPVLVSGVHPDVRLADLMTHHPLSDVAREHIQLDYDSLTTRQNVLTTRAWVPQNHIAHVGIVTSTYHTLRVRLLMRWLAPEVAYTLLPVRPDNAGWRLLWREYNKFLASPFLG